MDRYRRNQLWYGGSVATLLLGGVLAANALLEPGVSPRRHDPAVMAHSAALATANDFSQAAQAYQTLVHIVSGELALDSARVRAFADSARAYTATAENIRATNAVVDSVLHYCPPAEVEAVKKAGLGMFGLGLLGMASFFGYAYRRRDD